MSDAETEFLIYSREHNAWWRAASAGYTRSPAEAGRYTLEQAFRIVNEANEFADPEFGPNEFAYPALTHADLPGHAGRPF